jgi:hypothetical protein
VIYTDASIPFDLDLGVISRYADKVRQTAFEALQEEAVLVAAHKVYHSG